MNDVRIRRRLFIIIAGFIWLALFAPYMLAIQGLNRIVLVASTWSMIVIESTDASSNGWMLIIPPWSALPIVFVILIPRLLYVYTIWGYYTNRNQKGDFFWGVILILAQLLIPCIYYYFNPVDIEFLREDGPLILKPGPGVGELICIPIPILLCVGLLLLGYWKPHLDS